MLPKQGLQGKVCECALMWQCVLGRHVCRLVLASRTQNTVHYLVLNIFARKSTRFVHKTLFSPLFLSFNTDDVFMFFFVCACNTRDTIEEMLSLICLGRHDINDR